jgi:DNA-binding MarR family transcriptional regulator
LVARQVNDLDRRKVDHFLTARGRALLNKIDAALKRDLDHLLSLVDKRSAQGAWKSIETWDLALDRDRTA